MKFFVDNWYLFVLALASGSMLLVPALRGASFGGLTAANAVLLINREKAVVIDVCEPAEFEAGHIGGARSIPLGQLEGAKGLPTNKTLPLVLVCASGMRARKAAAVARKLGHERVHVLEGGLAAWREAGLPVEKTA